MERIKHIRWESAKFHGSCAIVALVGLVSSLHRDFVGISWVQNFFSWLFRGPKTFSRGYFVGLKCGSEIFSHGYFVGQNFFLVSISWIHLISCRWFRDSKILSCWLHEQEWKKQQYKNTSETTCFFLNWFKQLSTLYIRKVHHLLNYLRYYAFSFVVIVFLGISFLQY